PALASCPPCPYTPLFRSDREPEGRRGAAADREQAGARDRQGLLRQGRGARDPREPPAARGHEDGLRAAARRPLDGEARGLRRARSEEHTSELQSRENLVC